jgi:hypothetical protein
VSAVVEGTVAGECTGGQNIVEVGGFEGVEADEFGRHVG